MEMLTLQGTPNLSSLLRELCQLPCETEWVEFKKNNSDAPMIGEYISALANSAALLGKQAAYMVWGIDDTTHKVLGTTFKPSIEKYKGQELESWLLQKMSPKINFYFHEFESDGNRIVLLEVQPATHTPVQFDGVEYIRVGSYKKKLRQFAEKERSLWRVFDRTPFERQVAASALSDDNVLKLLDYPSYFSLLEIPLPENKQGIISALKSDKLLADTDSGELNITNLGGILFAKDLDEFAHLSRKSVRLILYEGDSRIKTIREIESSKGYACGFEGILDYVKALVPSNEEIGRAFRKEVSMYPELAIRELIANSLIHQDFSISGTGPMLELFATRMEITNPGLPLVDTNRFLDSPPQSRNEALASFMRRINICEERGSGVDKVVFQTEMYQLPPPIFETTGNHTRAVLFGKKELSKMDKDEKIRACYLHCCLKFVNREAMNNTTIRERFGIETKNSAIASRIIKDAVQAKVIKPYDPDAGTRAMRYIPSWA